ncbi:MAG: winged helix-turn-helix transcriptional regulator [Candidatus Izemoplasmatales bacterium]|jgi:sugar/nucleoside kinase (ribokinase family)/DNA-binding CsgD family transcriptional regulator|nr:winged helix-turn-helix transcriptional regulator [Candidatus Izemoplasmatales bacterium]
MKLNDNEEKVLKILEEDPFISQQSIADKMNLSRPAIANLISGLQTKGYILGKPYMLKKEKYITCIGGANIDYSFKLKEDLIMETSNPVSSEISYGGVIRNIAENLVRLNEQVSLMTVVGNDVLGNRLLKDSKKLMAVFASDAIDNYNTGSYYSVIDKSGNMNVGFADMEINNLMDRTWVLEHRRFLNQSDWLIADANITRSGIEALIEYAVDEEKKLCLIGVSGPKMKNIPKDLLGVHLIITNLDESQAYFNVKEKNPEKLIKLWLEKNVTQAIITYGKKGVYFGNQFMISHQEALLVKEEDIVDVTGAGDAFSAATIYGLINEQELNEAVKLGVTSSSLTIKSNKSVNPNLSINLIKKELKNYEKLS